MKKTSSFHLEEDILHEIKEYQEKYNLSSRNTALERMLLERRNILTVLSMLKSNNNLIDINVNNEFNDNINTEKENDFILESMRNINNSMPD
ncbi:hypothetical protein [uncultured Clostridium sp.]|uniref:hypothetical protein n=1 Tax=uncultured Clostridium sp. TaxID=59620 RepID=UPI00262E6860|nr:hypothetical protein [uncultured Clostridium sp.]